MAIFEALVILTVIAFALLIIGVGVFALPVVALLWILYFSHQASIGGGIAIAGIAVAVAILAARGKRNKKQNGS